MMVRPYHVTERVLLQMLTCLYYCTVVCIYVYVHNENYVVDNNSDYLQGWVGGKECINLENV